MSYKIRRTYLIMICHLSKTFAHYMYIRQLTRHISMTKTDYFKRCQQVVKFNSLFALISCFCHFQIKNKIKHITVKCYSISQNPYNTCLLSLPVCATKTQNKNIVFNLENCFKSFVNIKNNKIKM